MALVLANRVQETSTTTGTGTLTLAGAVLGYQTFSAGIGVGNTCYYAITSSTGAWEVGIGTVGAGTLARTTLLSSSTGSLVSFTGTLNVYVTYPSEKSVNLDASNIITGYPITVKDNVFTLQDDVDPTKQAQFQLSGLTTGTTRSYTLPDISSTVAVLDLAQTWGAAQTFPSNGNLFNGISNVFGGSTGTGTTSLGTGATTTGNTKTVNIGTGGVSGSTTNITVGSANSSTTTILGTTVIGGAAGNQSLQVNNVASAVNYAQIVGAATGAAPTISAQGSDENIGLNLTGKGTSAVTVNSATATNILTIGDGTTTRFTFNRDVGAGSFFGFNSGAAGFTNTFTGYFSFRTNTNQEQVRITNTASAVNYLNLTGAATGAAPTISAQGSDATVGLNITSKSFGVVNINTGTGNVAQFQDRGTATITSPFVFRAGTVGAAAGTLTLPVAISIQIPDTQYTFKTSASTTGANSGLPQFVILGAASAVNYVQATGAVTTGAPELSAQGSDANINLKLTPKGTGGISHTGTAFSPNINLTDAATIAWDTTTAGSQVATFTFVSSNRTMGAPTGLINGAFYALAVIQNAGSNTLTWNSVFKWAAGTAPTLSTAAGAKDYFTFRSDGTNLYQQGISQAVA